MTHEERGIYWDLCAHYWLEGKLSSDLSELADLVGLPLMKFKECWRRIQRCFEEDFKGRFHQPRLKREKLAQKRRKKVLSERGKRGAEKLHSGKGLGAKAMATPPVKHGSSSSSSATHKKREDSPIPPQALNEFDEFYGHYPKKVSRKDARKAWEKIKPNKELAAKISKAIQAQVKADHFRGTGGKLYIPHPATWLNAGRWEDEIQVVPPEEEKFW